jgi:hypothetical protein
MSAGALDGQRGTRSPEMTSVGQQGGWSQRDHDMRSLSG